MKSPHWSSLNTGRFLKVMPNVCCKSKKLNFLSNVL